MWTSLIGLWSLSRYGQPSFSNALGLAIYVMSSPKPGSLESCGSVGPGRGGAGARTGATVRSLRIFL